MVDRMRRSVMILLSLLVAPALAHAQPIMVSADMRPAIDLDGAWTWSIDPYGTGLQNFHGAAPSPAARRYSDFDVTEAMRHDPAALYEFDMDRSPVVHLPQSFVTHSPEMRHYNGLVWYQRHFIAHPRAGQRAFLRFGAVDYRAGVWLNGSPVGEHEGG
ncbi:MAG TPA: beta-glucuronidase, partial [Sphingomicrobium sp.]|nr:beta-glucuronidase [Sphingomicrobium sp.]